MPDFLLLWEKLFWPLLRLLMGMALGLLAANLLESLHWTRHLARLATPLARIAHLGNDAAAAFSTAFVSPAAANALLAEACEQQRISQRELMLANLFNSLPAFLVHTPSIFLLTWPVLGWPALVYVGLTLPAALARTAFTVLLARCWLPRPTTPASCLLEQRPGGIRQALRNAWQRFRRRLPKLIGFTIPVYIAMFLLQCYGCFQTLEQWLAAHAQWLSFLKPQAMGIIVLHLAAELGAALSAAGSVLVNGGLSAEEVILALLVGNILSTPMRALRHQLPAYAGFFRPAMALKLIVANQGLRALSMLVITALYWLWIQR